jgi:uncharacterized protein YjbJ (UPF0337 family)
MRYVIHIKGDWEDLKPKLRNKYPSLTDADLAFTEGKYEEMIISIGEKLGKTRQEFIRLLNQL